jgi:methylmalonyl-CoA mutase
LPQEVIRSTPEEKENQIGTVVNLREAFPEEAKTELRNLQLAAIHNENVFAQLMEASKYCSIGRLTNSLFDVGGQYRRSM